jgi:transcription factor E
LGIISSIRKKDKRKGWYIYFWTFNVLKSLEVLEQSISDEISSLQNELNSKKQKRFYKCQFCGRESNEETALLSNFTCPECGEVYGLMDNAPLLAEVSKKIEKLFRERESIRNEIKKEQDLINAKLGRQMKREEKKKKELRRKAFEERKKLKQKNKKSSFKDKKNKKKL